MDRQLLAKHIKPFVHKYNAAIKSNDDTYKSRHDRIAYYQEFTNDKILSMSSEAITEYFSKLWAMLIWGNKQYYIDKLIADNGFEQLKKNLADLVWGVDPLEIRWDTFRRTTKGLGPAMISEILCNVHSEDCIIWNRRAFVGLNYLGVKNLPRYSYQLTGAVYIKLIDVMKEIMTVLRSSGIPDASLMTVDYFLWEELQGAESLKKALAKDQDEYFPPPVEESLQFIHNDIRDGLAEIGNWLGFTASTEIKVADGSKVDTIWEATIGNMGRVIYVFEVQTKGSIDSLIVNLVKALNNPAVQGVVAVSDKEQLERIKKHAAGVGDLKNKLKYWDYEIVLQVRESLEFVNQSINELALVPEGF